MAGAFENFLRPDQPQTAGTAFEPVTRQQQLGNYQNMVGAESAWKTAEESPWNPGEPGMIEKAFLHPATQSIMNAASFIGPGPKMPQPAMAPKGSGGAFARKSLFDWGPRETSGTREVKIGDTTITYGVNPKTNYAQVVLVETPKAKRGQGSARTAMQQMMEEADANGVTLSLTADPMDKGVSKARLESFYKSLGFTPNKGKNKDFSVMSGMIRPPRKGAFTSEE